MNLRSGFLTITIILNLLTVIFSQVTNDNSDMAEAILIDKDKPSVYISFEKSGKAPPLFRGETEDRFWLRLKNNTKGSVSFCYSKTQRPYGDIVVRYNLEKEDNSGATGGISPDYNRVSRSPDVVALEPIGNGYAITDSCVTYVLLSGMSVLFSVPKVHLFHGSTSYRIEIPFNYGWEHETTIAGTSPKHILSFSYSRLPSSITQAN